MAGVYQFHIEIKEIKPPIWRQVKVNDSYFLSDLGNVINYVFDWSGAHLSEFRIDGNVYGRLLAHDDPPENLIDSMEIRLRDLSLRKGSEFTYIYDFGDWWELNIEMELHEKGSGLLFPLCTGGRRNSPPEDCGGLPGYQMLMENKAPDWPNILRNCTDDIFSIIILNNNTGYDATAIKSFDYEKLLTKVETPLELRKVDARQFHIYGFLYSRTRHNNYGELEYLLSSDLHEFIQLTRD